MGNRPNHSCVMNDVEITTLLSQIRSGNRTAMSDLSTAVYDQLYRMAARKKWTSNGDDTLHPSALVNETFAKLLQSDSIRKAPNRKYLFGAAATAMREIIADHARRRAARKRTAPGHRLPLDGVLEYFRELNIEYLELNEALDELSEHDPRRSQVVQMKFFLGLTTTEIAEELGLSVSTVESDWRLARAWLFGKLKSDEDQ